MTRLARLGLALLLLLGSGMAIATEEMLMVRSNLTFPEAMSTLQESIHAHGYTLSRVQRVDVGLTNMGYKTDKYRVVFFGKLDEFRTITNRYPVLMAYLPFSITIFAEGDQTLLVSINPAQYKTMVPPSELSILFDRCESDVRSILDDVRNAE